MTRHIDAICVRIGRLTALMAVRQNIDGNALAETVVEGINTNLSLHQELLNDAAFITGATSIHFLEQRMAKLKKIAGDN